jgi:hypothetical protein
MRSASLSMRSSRDSRRSTRGRSSTASRAGRRRHRAVDCRARCQPDRRADHPSLPRDRSSHAPANGCGGGGGTARWRSTRGPGRGCRNALVRARGRLRRRGSALARGRVAAAARRVACFATIAALADTVSIARMVPLEKSPEVLAERALQVSARAGYRTPSVDRLQVLAREPDVQPPILAECGFCVANIASALALATLG